MPFLRRRARTTGFPTSSNGASSMHLWWETSPAPTTEVSAVLEIVEPPVVAHLYFWALQVSFVDAGRTTGGAHLGLQWYDRHPGGTAVNWGGYRTGSGELDGEASRLPSATGNPNTRDFPWRARVGYRLCIRGDGDGWWTGEVTDTTTGQQTVVRRLRGGGTALARPVVWSEVFARCDDPRTAVRWSELQPPPAGVRVTYQAQADGGCANTAVVHEGDSYLQITNAPRPDR